MTSFPKFKYCLGAVYISIFTHIFHCHLKSYVSEIELSLCLPTVLQIWHLPGFSWKIFISPASKACVQTPRLSPREHDSGGLEGPPLYWESRWFDAGIQEPHVENGCCNDQFKGFCTSSSWDSYTFKYRSCWTTPSPPNYRRLLRGSLSLNFVEKQTWALILTLPFTCRCDLGQVTRKMGKIA